MSDSPDRYNEFVEACLNDPGRAGEMLESNAGILDARSEHAGETPLHFLVIENRVEEVRWLIARGAKVDAADYCGHTPLLSAAIFGLAAMVELLIGAGANPRGCDENGETPLHGAARSEANSVLIIEMLVAAGAEPNARCSLGRTPLHVAYEHKNAPAVEALLNAGADVDTADLGGERFGQMDAE